MQLFIFICLAHFYLGDTCSQVPVEKLDEGMLYRNRQLDQLKQILHSNRQSGPQPDLDIWWRHPHLQNGAHAEKHEGRSLPGSLLRLEVSFPHTTLRAVTLDNEKSGVWRKNAVRWTFVRSWEVKRPNTRVFQLKEMPDKEQNIEKKKVSVIFWTFGKIFFEIYIKFACW